MDNQVKISTILSKNNTSFDKSAAIACEKIITDEFRCEFGISEAEDQEAIGKMMQNEFDNYSLTSSIEESDILWFGRPFNSSDVNLVPRVKGYLNRICGTEIFREKELQYTIMNQLKEFLPDEYKYHPSSYSLMKEYELLQKDVLRSAPNKLWIAKPSDGGDGDDIFLFKTMEELHDAGVNDDMVVQHYIANPLILKKKKWDARVYLIIHGINPMKGYISVDCGFGRFCTEDYDNSDTSNVFSHITNSAINSKSEKFMNSEEGVEDSPDKVASRYYFSHIWKMIKEEYPEANIDDMKQQIKDISTGILRSFRAAIEVKSCQILEIGQNVENNDKFFHILGLDIMFDDNFNAWLIETNRFPSMALYFNSPNEEGVLEQKRSVIDEKVKSTLINE